MTERADRTERTMTTAMLKAFANPLRRDMMRVFAKQEFLRAADIAEELGEPANKISFHLRVMADAGLIIEAPERARDGRDRVWTPIKESLNVGAPSSSAEDIALGNAVMTAMAEDHIALVRRIVAHGIEMMTEEHPDRSGTLRVHSVHLTEAEYEALMDTLSAAIRDAQDAHDRSAGGGRAWQVDIVAADTTI